MGKKISTKLSTCFLFPLIGLLILFSPPAGKAQENSGVNLVGTSWNTGQVIIPTQNTDNSVTALTRNYDFDRQGKVNCTIIKNKSAGGEYKLVWKWVLENQYNAVTGKYEMQSVYKYVQDYVHTMPESNSEILKGIYEIKGKSIYLDFPDHTISATIYSNSMKGILIYKGTKEKERWEIEKTSGVGEIRPAESARGNAGSPSVPGANLGFQDVINFRNKCLDGLTGIDGILVVKMKDGSIKKIDLSQRGFNNEVQQVIS